MLQTTEKECLSNYNNKNVSLITPFPTMFSQDFFNRVVKTSGLYERIFFQCQNLLALHLSMAKNTIYKQCTNVQDFSFIFSMGECNTILSAYT